MSESRNWPALRRSRWSGFSVHMGKKNSNGSYEVSTSCIYEVSCHPLMLCTWHSACSHVDTWLPVQYIGFTPYVRFTPTSRGTWDWLTTKKWPNCRLLGSCSYVSRQKVRSYSWILAINRATRHWNRLLTVKIGRGSCQFNLRVTQLAAGSSFGRKSLQVGRYSLDGLVCHSARS